MQDGRLQRRFLERLDEAGPLLRSFVESAGDAGVKWRFDDAVRALRVFRTIHMKRGSHSCARAPRPGRDA